MAVKSKRKRQKGHQTNQGKLAFNRGKPPHKGGYHAASGDDKQCFPVSWWEYMDENGIRHII